ncbi:MAG: hypothetical protein RL071_218 [Pseudomonadota bacterium]|jgi:hypothetical protein
MPTLLLLLALLGAAQAEDQSPDAPKLRLKVAQSLVSTGLSTSDRSGGPFPASSSTFQYTSAQLSSGPTRAELTYRMRPRFELGGSATVALRRATIGGTEGGSYTGGGAGLGLTAIHNTPLRPGAVLFAQVGAGYSWSSYPSNMPNAGTRTHGLGGRAAVGLRLKLAEQVNLEPALTGAAGGSWTTEDAAADPDFQDHQSTWLGGGAELGLSFRF